MKVTTNKKNIDAVEGNRKLVTSIVQDRIRDEAETEDVVQDVFMEFLEAYDLGMAIESLGAWLVRVAQNKVLDRFRRKKVRDDYTKSQTEAVNEPNEANRPDNEAVNNLLRKAIVEAIDTLPTDQREVFILNELEGKTFEEIAIETGVSINTLLSRKRYAVMSLREKLKEIYDELE